MGLEPSLITRVLKEGKTNDSLGQVASYFPPARQLCSILEIFPDRWNAEEEEEEGEEENNIYPNYQCGRLYPLVTITTEGECVAGGERECLGGICCLDLADDNSNMSGYMWR